MDLPSFAQSEAGKVIGKFDSCLQGDTIAQDEAGGSEREQRQARGKRSGVSKKFHISGRGMKNPGRSQ